MEVSRYSRKGIEIILIGHSGHPEVEGTMGQYDTANGGDIYLVEIDGRRAEPRGDAIRPSCATSPRPRCRWTTRRSSSMRCTRRFPQIQGPKKEDICYATQNRQDAVKQLAERCDLILVVGSQNSSNSNRLREIAENKQIEGYLIDSEADIRTEWLADKRCIGVTAGASAPELLVQNVVRFLQQQGAGEATSLGFTEDVIFPLPKPLRTATG